MLHVYVTCNKKIHYILVFCDIYNQYKQYLIEIQARNVKLSIEKRKRKKVVIYNIIGNKGQNFKQL